MVVEVSAMTLAEVISDIHILNRELEVYEEKYGLLSKDFHELYIQGKLRDEEIEEIDEYGRWAAFYEIRTEQEATYSRLVEERLTALRQAQPAMELTSVGAR
jgi:hypothetical protein